MSDSEERIITPAVLREWPLPQPGGDKHSRGTVVVAGGAAATPGAVMLAGVAALRSGAGVLQIHCDPTVATALAVSMPEARVAGWPSHGSDPDERASVLLIGPGLDTVEQAEALLRWAVQAPVDTPLVVDAFALSALAQTPTLLHGRKTASVITPNATEAGILLGRKRATRPATAARLRGHIATPEGRQWREDGGDTGLGTSGSGDVLAGITAGLLARGADPEQAACWSVHVHAVSGQRLSVRFGRTGFLARELADETASTIAALEV
jgi:ADP-dependent NAD(P)H-hydrate dehydratase